MHLPLEFLGGLTINMLLISSYQLGSFGNCKSDRISICYGKPHTGTKNSITKFRFSPKPLTSYPSRVEDQLFMASCLLHRNTWLRRPNFEKMCLGFAVRRSSHLNPQAGNRTKNKFIENRQWRNKFRSEQIIEAIDSIVLIYVGTDTPTFKWVGNQLFMASS